MATLLRKESLIQTHIVLLGTPKACQALWSSLKQFATVRRGDDAFMIPERRTDDGPNGLLSEYLLRLEFQRFATTKTPTVQALTEAMNVADAVIVAMDLDDEKLLAEFESVLTRALEMVFPSGWERARSLVGVTQGQSNVETMVRWQNLDRRWRLPPTPELIWSGFADKVNDAFTISLLKSQGARIRAHFLKRPPQLHPIHPSFDLEGELRISGEKHLKNVQRAEPEAKSGAFMALSELYAQAGESSTSKVLIRKAFDVDHAVDIWKARITPEPPLEEYLPLKQWELPAEAPRDVIFVPPRGESFLIAMGNSLLKVERASSGFKSLMSYTDPIRRLCALNGSESLAFWDDLIGVVSNDTGETLREGTLPIPLMKYLTRVADPRFRKASDQRSTFEPEPLKVRVSMRNDRLLLCSPVGVWLLNLSEFKVLSHLERPGILDVGMVPGQRDIWTAHADGMVGRWSPDTGVVQRVANFPAPLIDASISNSGHCAGLTRPLNARRSSQLILVSLRDGRTLLTRETLGASALKISMTGRRLLAFESQMMRLHDLSPATFGLEPRECIGDHNVARSLRSIEAHVPRRVDLLYGGRYIASVERSANVDEPAFLRLWG